MENFHLGQHFGAFNPVFTLGANAISWEKNLYWQ
jgi:hypothetical protein